MIVDRDDGVLVDRWVMVQRDERRVVRRHWRQCAHWCWWWLGGETSLWAKEVVGRTVRLGQWIASVKIVCRRLMGHRKIVCIVVIVWLRVAAGCWQRLQCARRSIPVVQVGRAAGGKACVHWFKHVVKVVGGSRNDDTSGQHVIHICLITMWTTMVHESEKMVVVVVVVGCGVFWCRGGGEGCGIGVDRMGFVSVCAEKTKQVKRRGKYKTRKLKYNFFSDVIYENSCAAELAVS